MKPIDFEHEYLNCVYDLMEHEAVRSMSRLPQHRVGVSCYDHSLLVSYGSWRVCRALGLNSRAAARGGLLHDFYLYNWQDRHSHPGVRHAFQHPEIALKNARARFFITDTEADIIRSHMFPLTITRPHRTLEAAVVGVMDKLCAAAELLGLLTPPAEAYRSVHADMPQVQDARWTPAPVRRAG